VVARTTIGVLCLSLLLAIGLGAGGAAAATKKRPPSRISLDSINPDGAHGKVSSRNAKCLAHRTVTLYMEASWTSVPTSNPVATTHTRRDGAWSIDGPINPNEYYATVGPRRMKTLVCGDAGSNANWF
jgi:hypothetical protein